MVSEWEHIVLDQRFGEPPVDVLIINDGEKITMARYERSHNFVYLESIKDYIFKYTSSIEFLTTYNYLLKNRHNAMSRH